MHRFLKIGLVVMLVLIGSVVCANQVKFRPGGTGGYTDITMDDTYVEVWTTSVYGTATSMRTNASSAYPPGRVGLMGWATLFSVLPPTCDSSPIVIDNATLYLISTRTAGTPLPPTIRVARMTTQWLVGSAGTNESNVHGGKSSISGNVTWAGGNFSLSDLTLTNAVEFSTSGITWGSTVTISITQLMQDLYNSGVNRGFAFIHGSTPVYNTYFDTATSEYSSSWAPALEITYHYAVSAPTNLDATAIGPTEIDLTWTDNSNNESTFRIERKTGADGTYAEIGTTNANVTSYADTTCSASTTYYYRVRARTTSGLNSNYSNEDGATTPSPVPAAPSNLVATTVDAAEIDLTWTDNSNNESTFRVERKTGAGGTYAEIGSVAANVTSYADTTCSPSTTYYYRVRARTSGGTNSNYSDEDDATTSAPTLVKVRPGGGSGYSDITMDDTYVEPWSTSVYGTATSMTVSGYPGTYPPGRTGLMGWATLFSVIPPTSGGKSIIIDNATLHLVSTTTGSAPPSIRMVRMTTQWLVGSAGTNESNVHGGKSSISGNVTWAGGNFSLSDLTLTNAVEFSTSSVSWGSPVTINITQLVQDLYGSGTNKGFAFIHGSTPTDSTFFYAATSEYSTAWAPALDISYHYQGNGTPAAPSNLVATAVNHGEIDLAWTDNSNNESTFRIERKTGAGGTYAEIASVGANTTSYADTTCAAETQYYYRVRACTAGGTNSNYSNEDDATTPVDPTPTNLVATTVSSSEIDLAWTDHSSDESTFRIERKTGADGTYAEIGTTNANVTSYADTTCSASTTYYYRVRARTSGGTNSDYSNQAIAWTPPASAPASFFDWNASILPHSRHITTELIDFQGPRPSADYDWLVAHYDWVMTDPGSSRPEYRSRTPVLMFARYAILLTVLQTGDNIRVSYYPDMQTWYAAHPQYNIEDAFLHKSGARMTKVIWATDRWIMNPGDPGLIAYNKDRLARVSDGDDFLFIDEYGSAEINTYAGSDEYPVLTDLQDAEVSLLSTLHASLGKILQINTAEYTADLDRRCGVASGGIHQELANNALQENNPGRWTFRESCLSNGVFVQPVSPWLKTDIDAMSGFPAGNDLSQYGRMRMCELAGYYMVVPVPATMLAHSFPHRTPLANDWIKAIEVNTGAPQAARYTYQSGTDGRGKAYTVYAREMEKCLVIYRPAKAWNDLVWDDTTAVTVNLPGGETWKQVRSDGTLAGSFVTSVSLLQAEAMIMMKGSKLGLPGAPTRLAATAVSATQVNLSWLDYSGDENTFRIERKTGSGGTYSEIGTVSANVTTYADTTCSGSTTYYYRVRSRTSAGVNSSYSNEDHATTP